MKKIYSTLAALGLAATMQAQIIVFVQQPPGLSGSYAFTWADPGGGWGTADLNDPLNAITGTAAFVDDGSAADSLGCDTLVNGASVAGKIAVCYRGTCNFSLKALMAQNEGAIGCVIINNAPGGPVGMGAGTYGADVTIPTVMISQDAGADLKSEIEAGNVVMFIGAINGAFTNNLSVYKADPLLARSTAYPAALCSNATEFNVQPGAWVHNYGTTDQTGVTLSGEVTNGGSLYNQTSAGVDILAGDSVFIDLPEFNQSAYSGLYSMKYTIGSGITDDLPNDNEFTNEFLIDSLYTLAKLDANQMPIPADFYQPSGLTGTFQSCVHFRDPNASRIGAMGLYVSVPGAAADSVTGDLIEIRAFEWNDVFTGIADATTDDLNEVAFAEYTYADNSLEGQLVYIPFEQAFQLVNDQRYLFCLTTYDVGNFQGFDNYYNYEENTLVDDQPTTVVDNAGTWAVAGFGTDVPSAIGVLFGSADVSVQEGANAVDLTAFPNPSNSEVKVPMTGFSGMADLRVVDVNGKLVKEQRVNVGNGTLVVNVSDVAAGTYTFNMNFADGRTSAFRVVVSK
ncbi:MAG: T9SS type A sorting domain-containing protein [Flavobacteriales bacterium]|nr:T9SS type A sorting domain-containing protein [Flavobacteriales bacterium]